MKNSDLAIIKGSPVIYGRALAAAAMSLREDRRMLGVPRIRARLEELAALHAPGSETAPFTKGEAEKISTETIEIALAAFFVATEAAKTAISA